MSRIGVLLAGLVALSVGGLPPTSAAAGRSDGNEVTRSAIRGDVASLPAAFGAPPMERIGGSAGAFRATSASKAYIVRTKDDASLQSLMGRLASRGVRTSEKWNESVFGVVVELNAAALESVQHDPAVISVEADQPVHITASQTSPPWGLDRIDQRSQPLDGSYNYAPTGVGVTAYVLDTGLWFSHYEFTGRVMDGAYIDFGDGFGPWDCNGHGTHVSGTIGGTTYGVAKDVTIVPVKVLDCSGSGSYSGIISGLVWAVEDHQAGVPAVANLSFGGPASSALDAAVQALIDDGVTVVVAAGNDNAPTCGDSPARVAAAITVAASEIDDTRATFSNYGSCNDLFAPGTNILSAFGGSDDATAVRSGTSMASPHVAGAAALLLQTHHAATPAQIWSMIDTNSTPVALTAISGDPNKLLYVPLDLSVNTLVIGRSGTGAGTVTSDPSGEACGDSCSAAFISGSIVLLTETAATGSTFTGWVGEGCTDSSTCSVMMDTAKTITAVFTLTPTFVAVVPARLLDTRHGASTADGQSQGVGVRPAGSTTVLPIAGRGGVPADAAAVVLNVTVTDAQGGGYVALFPCGSPQPNASNLNFVSGQTIPNAVVTKVGTSGTVCIYTSADVQLIVDANGYFPAGSSFAALVPARLLDTRPGASTADGQFQGVGVRSGGSVTTLPITGRGGVPADAAAVVLNVTVTDAQGGYVTVFPCSSVQPNASNLNFTSGQTIPNAVVAKIGASGTVCIYTSATVQLIVDVNGYFPAGSSFAALVPARLLDTRPGASTADGEFQGVGVRTAGSVTVFPVIGRGGVPIDAAAVVLNVTVTDAQGGGYVTVFPCGSAQPNASNLNFVSGQTIPNAVVAKVGTSGTICIYTSADVQLIVDANGDFPTV